MPKKKITKAKANGAARTHATVKTKEETSPAANTKIDQAPGEDKTEPAVQPDVPFRFLDLPPELRNEIYSYAMPGSNNLRSRDLATLQFPAITRASKQLREESLGLLFAECHFVICVGTNYHHRSYVTSVYAKKPCRWDVVKDCGTLGFRPVVRKFLKTAGKAALFQDVTFNVYHPKDVSLARYEHVDPGTNGGNWLRDQRREGSLHLKVTRDRKLEVVIEEASWAHASRVFVEEAKKDAKKVAEELGKREGFRGLRMGDLHRIAKAFYWKPKE